MILRAMVSTRKTDYETEDEYIPAERAREPLLNPQANQTSVSSIGDGKGAYLETWSSRMREKVFFFYLSVKARASNPWDLLANIYLLRMLFISLNSEI